MTGSLRYREYAYTGKWADGSPHTDTVYVPMGPFPADTARSGDRIVWDVQDYPNKHLASQVDRQWAARWLRIRRFAAWGYGLDGPDQHKGELRIREGGLSRRITEYVPNMPVDAYAEPGKVVLHGDGMEGYGYKSGETAEGSAYQEQRLDAGNYDDFHFHTECDEHGTDCSGLADGETCEECEKVQDCRDGNCECITKLEQCEICNRDLGDGDTAWLCLDGGEVICPEHVVHDERPDSLFTKVGGVRGAMLPAFAWPGGYCVVYLSRDNSALCAGCASKVDTSDPATEADVDEEMICGDCDHAQSEHASRSSDTDAVWTGTLDVGPCKADLVREDTYGREITYQCGCEGYWPPLCEDCQKPIDPALRAWWAAHRNKFPPEPKTAPVASFSDGTEEHPW